MKFEHFLIIAAIVGVISVVYFIRFLNATATTIVIKEPEPGIKCALATTHDGVALDCWKRMTPEQADEFVKKGEDS